MDLDDSGFQVALAQLLADSAEAEAFFTDPDAYAQRNGLSPGVARALETIDRGRLRLSASIQVADKALAARRHFRATLQLLSALDVGSDGERGRIARQVYRAHTASALQAVLLQLLPTIPAGGPLSVLADMIRFESMWYQLEESGDPRGAATSCGPRPRLAPNAMVGRFGCPVAEVYQRVQAGQHWAGQAPDPTCYLLQIPTDRTMRLLRIEPETADVLSECDGRMAVEEIAAKLVLEPSMVSDLIEQAHAAGLVV
jgi:hypothetical protein